MSAIRVDHEQGATFVELFFDLVFVYAVTQLTAAVRHDLAALVTVVAVRERQPRQVGAVV